LETFSFTIRRPGVGEGRILLEVYGDGDRMIAGIRKLYGWINVPPKQWLRIVRAEIRTIERICKESGCRELRVAGRDWSRILTDYEPYDGPRNGLRKVL
jgi:hypothetical protein